MIEALFFDLYETLISELCINADPETHNNKLRLNIPDDVFRREYRARRDKRMTGVYRDYASVLRDICIAAGEPVDEDLITRIQTERIAFHKSIAENVEANILQLLSKIKSMGLKTGLITNVSCDEAVGVASSPISDYVDCIIYSCETGYAKPSPEIYLVACEKIGVRPENSVFVGDGASNELVGADNVGMRPYQATWFFERWPEEWRLMHERKWNTNYPKLHKPEELITLIERECQ